MAEDIETAGFNERLRRVKLKVFAQALDKSTIEDHEGNFSHEEKFPFIFMQKAAFLRKYAGDIFKK